MGKYSFDEGTDNSYLVHLVHGLFETVDGGAPLLARQLVLVHVLFETQLEVVVAVQQSLLDCGGP